MSMVNRSEAHDTAPLDLNQVTVLLNSPQNHPLRMDVSHPSLAEQAADRQIFCPRNSCSLSTMEARPPFGRAAKTDMTNLSMHSLSCVVKSIVRWTPIGSLLKRGW
ncbi:uncharacterized protein PHALS_10018 [Plasmopara halstedii]|uniref:Uncharacterized protein n=1 Tax=Plasmopara halstedii TaxID=4781 RepID=A0A0P1AH25_PLAHL|nr:uncharacterized protein PHALS_10018 [Plasmopara halstedii]CEG39782.1 hypothetical protein PHALS_10018 [Plasmopara halstedii]|eukprot:XP_024576151.1 hypothetical protein PHALS_10018 [Plasmopara halstedii]